MTVATARKPKRIHALDLSHVSKLDKREVGQKFCALLDVAGTAMGRATFYNTKEEQKNAAVKVHEDLFGIDRGIYGMTLLLPGVTDFARQVGLGVLLDQPYQKPSALSAEQESKLIAYLVRQLPPQRMLKMFGDFRKNKVNNARTRKLILRSILNAGRLEFWSVKYRTKMRAALEHAWGVKMAGIVRSILSKSSARHTKKEKAILRKHLENHTNAVDRKGQKNVHECVAFILGVEKGLTLPLFKAYHDAREELEAGKKLPYEVLEGIRSKFHKGRKNEDVLKLTKHTLTKGQKIGMQRKAEKQKVKVDFDPKDYDSIKLYIYAFERGLSQDVSEALEEKAKESASGLPVRYGHVGILIDSSESMAGHHSQALRPIATALATRDMLMAASDKVTVKYSGGQEDDGLVRPSGETALAEDLVGILKKKPESVFIFTDGYENAPAGRLDETVRMLRDMGNDTPIYQISPVMAAENKAIRTVSDEVSAMPLSKPETMGLTMVKAMMESDTAKGILGVARLVLPKLGMEV
jgi:hypothetical protein